MPQKQKARNTIMWKEAERTIDECDADVLLIFDCCHAGLIGRSSAPKRFETLAACTADTRTHIPGKTSFTTALIWALRELRARADKPFFPSSELRTTIMRCPDIPKHQIPQLNERIPNLQHIVMAPFAPGNKSLATLTQDQKETVQAVKTSYIDLRFHFDDCDEEKIIDVAKLLRKYMLDDQVPAQRIDFLGKNSVWNSNQWQAVATYGTFWFEHTKREKHRKLSSFLLLFALLNFGWGKLCLASCDKCFK